MFKQLSQIGKNLSDEFAKGLSDDVNTGQEAVVDDNSGLPREVQIKLRKFDKYEEKYPRLLAAYKNERLKLEKITAVEKVLTENTPVSSIDDVETLAAFFRDSAEKQKMLNDEIKRLVSLNKESDRSGHGSELEASGSTEKETSQGRNQEQIEPNTVDEVKDQSAEIKKLESELEEKEVELATVKDKYNELLKNEQVNEESKRELDSTKQALSDLQQQHDNTDACHKEEVDSLTKRIDEASEDASAKAAEMERLQKEVEEKEEQLTNLKNNVTGNSPTANNDSNSRATGKNNKRKNKKKNNGISSNKNATNAAAELADKEEEHKKLVEEVEKLREMQESAHDNTQEWETKYGALQSQMGDSKEVETDLRNLLKTSNDKCDELQNELNEKSERLKNKGTELEEVREMLRDVGNELVEAKDQLKNSSSVKQEEFNSLVAEKDKSVKLYEKRESELLVEVDKLKAHISTLNTNVASQEAEKKAMEKKLDKLNESLSSLKNDNTEQAREVNTLKRTIVTMKSAILQKEKTISYLEQQVKDYSEKSGVSKKEADDLRKESENASERIESLRKENEELRKDVKKNSSSFEGYLRENGKLSERINILQEKYDTLQNLKSNSSEQVDSIKRQCEELNVKLKESNKKIISLEEEINDYSNSLQEKTREANTMRRLLTENTNDENQKESALQQRLEFIIDEKTNLESELAMQASRRAREAQDWKATMNELKSEIHDLKLREKELQAEISSLTVLNSNMQRRSSNFVDNSNDLEKITSNLKEALAKADSKVRDLQESNENLMKVNDDVNKKLDRMSKNYRTLMNQLNTLKEEKSDRMTRSSRSSSVASNSSHQTPQPEMRRSHSFLKEAPVVESQSELNEKIAYIKNVLLGFLEHRDQRSQLLPVVSMLLQLDSGDEKRLLMSIK